MVVQYRSGDEKFPENHDLRGKIIYPFVTNEGWAGHALQDFATNLSGGCVNPE